MLTDDATTRPQMRAALDITILRTLVMIVDSGGFTRAAERLGITQSAVSLQIKRLEEATGQSMFVREGRQVHLTSDGEMLLDYAREIVRLEEEARLRLVEPGERRSVSLWATEDIATAYLNNLQAASQRIALNVRSDNPASVVNQMAQGAFDLALVRREPGATRGGAWRHDLAWIEPLGLDRPGRHQDRGVLRPRAADPAVAAQYRTPAHAGSGRARTPGMAHRAFDDQLVDASGSRPPRPWHQHRAASHGAGRPYSA